MPVRQSCGHPVDIQPEQEQNGVKMASKEAIKLLKNLFLEPIYFSTVCFDM